MKRFALALVAALSLAAPAAQATTLLQDNFNAENGGVGKLNYVSFSNWTVNKGTVDLIGNGFWDLVPGNGLFLDMDGSGIDSGGIVSASNFSFLAGRTYTLNFRMAGSQRGRADGATNTVRVGFGTVSQDITLTANAAFALYQFSFTAAANSTGALSFTSLDRRDNQGLLLDDVLLSESGGATDITEPTTLAMIATALLLMAGLKRRREGARALG